MQFKLGLIPAATALMLVACGGGSNPGPSPSLTPSKGVAVDGYLQFSKVVCDANENGLFETGETAVYTLADGTFTFPSGCKHSVLVTGGVNADTQLNFVGQLKAPAGATVASPLTTLISAGMTQDQIIKALDLPANTDLLKTDPAASTSGVLDNPGLMKKTLAVQQLMQKVTELSTGLSSVSGSVASEAVYANVASTFATMLKTSASLIKSDGTLNSDVVKTMVTTAVTNVTTSPSVPTEVKTALSAAVTKAGGASNISAVAVVALAEQGNALLSASDSTITAVTLAKQGNTSIATTIKAAITEEKLSAATNTASISVLAQQTATAATTTTVPPTTPTSAAFISFDESVVAFTGMGAYGGALPSVVMAPGDSTGKALKIVKPTGATADGNLASWGGVYFGTAKIPFTATNKTITAKVYSTRADAVIKLKVESSNGGPAIEVASAPTGTAQTWKTVSWDLTGIDTDKNYTTIAITPDQEVVPSDKAYYFDDISVVASSSPSTPAPTNYLYLSNNALALTDGASAPTTTTYTLADFTGTGINVKWPMPNTAAIKLNLAESGTFTMAQGQTLKAAVSITQDTPAGSGEVQGYIDNILVSKAGSNITVTIPTLSKAMVYGVTGDGNKSAIIDFKEAVVGITNTLTSVANSVSTILLGDVVNFAVNGVSNDFTGMYSLTGKYKVTIVVTELPLRKADGSEFPIVTVNIPTQLDSNGKAVVATSQPVTGRAIVGYINLIK
jgi:uncharacterized protein YfiM (DUF2279 family)